MISQELETTEQLIFKGPNRPKLVHRDTGGSATTTQADTVSSSTSATAPSTANGATGTAVPATTATAVTTAAAAATVTSTKLPSRMIGVLGTPTASSSSPSSMSSVQARTRRRCDRMRRNINHPGLGRVSLEPAPRSRTVYEGRNLMAADATGAA